MSLISALSERKKERKTQPSKIKWRDFSKIRTEEAEGFESDLLECLFLFLERGIWREEKERVLIKDRPLFLLLIFFVPLSHTIRSSKSKWTVAQRVHTDLKTASHAQSLKISDTGHYKLIFKQSE